MLITHDQAVTGSNRASAALPVLVLITLLVLVFCASIVSADGLFEFQQKLAEKGNAEAQFKVGEMYETGFGVEQDKDKAREWINKAADQGHEVAGYKLLYWDVEQNGITDDNKGDVGSLKKQAEEGHSYAQYYIGKMYAYGVGLSRNQQLARTMLNSSAVQGVIEAERELDLVRNNLRQDELAKRAEQDRKAALKRKQAEQKRKDLAAAGAAEKARQLKAERLQAERQAAERKAADVKQQQATDREAELEEQMLRAEREARRQELLKHRRKKEAERRAAFESDPCSGKSARFLSTCR